MVGGRESHTGGSARDNFMDSMNRLDVMAVCNVALGGPLTIVLVSNFFSIESHIFPQCFDLR